MLDSLWGDYSTTLPKKGESKKSKCLLSVSLPCLEARAPGTRRRVAIMEFDRRFLSPQVVQGDHARRSIIGHSRQGPWRNPQEPI